MGHWHKCEDCEAHTDAVNHDFNLEESTEDEAKYCLDCGYVAQAVKPHVHTPVVVTGYDSDCTNPGQKTYYVCSKASCAMWFWDATGSLEIADHDEVIIPEKGHDMADATCTAPSTCNRGCGHTEGTSLGHAWTERIEDAAHLRSEGQTCQEHDTYWFDCARCDVISTDNYFEAAVVGDHSYTEKVEDAAHLVSGTGVNCQSLKEYYFDCAYCDSVGTATWTSESCGEHVMSTTWTSENDKHFHECTVCGCDHIEDEANCSGGTATCTDLAVCAVCAKEYGDVLPHDFSGEWNEGNAAGHWHVCLDCGAKETPEAHIPGSDATEDTAQTCSECGYIITPALHVHELTAVEAVEVSCTDNGHEAYFYCACGAWYTDEAATHLVTDKGALVIEATGHDWLDVTCTAPKTCADCGATEGSALGHTDADNNAKCDTCGHQEDSSKPGSNTPQTGDNNHILFAVSMMAICLVAFIALICGKKRSK